MEVTLPDVKAAIIDYQLAIANLRVDLQKTLRLKELVERKVLVRKEIE